MKRSITGAFALFVLWANPVPASAGPLDWFLPHTADWKFIQSTGGMQILTPKLTGGRMILPVLYDASGQTEITCKPSALNSSIVVDKIKVSRSGSSIILRVTTCLRKDMGSTEGAGSIHYADLSGIPAGAYMIFYGRAGDPSTVLGQIEIK
jgi:hypothetical protein